MGLGKGGFELGDLIISMCLFYQYKGGRGLTLSCSCSVDARTSRLPCIQLKSPSGQIKAHPLRLPTNQLSSTQTRWRRGTYNWNKERPYHISPSIAYTLNSSLLLYHLSHPSLQLQK